MFSVAKRFLVSLSSTTPRFVSSTASWASIKAASEPASAAAATILSTWSCVKCAYSLSAAAALSTRVSVYLRTASIRAAFSSSVKTFFFGFVASFSIYNTSQKSLVTLSACMQDFHNVKNFTNYNISLWERFQAFLATFSNFFTGAFWHNLNTLDYISIFKCYLYWL